MEIKRDILDTFIRWKESPRRKPMLLQGARQIGKTWAVERFGKEHYKHFVKFDLDRSPEVIDAFRISMNNLQENGGLYSIPNPLSDWSIKFLLSGE